MSTSNNDNFGGMCDQVRVVGILERTRIQTSTKNESWKGYRVEVATIGKTITFDAPDEGTMNEYERKFKGKMVELKAQLKPRSSGGGYDLTVLSLEEFAPVKG